MEVLKGGKYAQRKYAAYDEMNLLSTCYWTKRAKGFRNAVNTTRQLGFQDPAPGKTAEDQYADQIFEIMTSKINLILVNHNETLIGKTLK